MKPIDGLLVQALQRLLTSLPVSNSPKLSAGTWLCLDVRACEDEMVELQWQGMRLRAKWPRHASPPDAHQWFEVLDAGPPLILSPRLREQLVSRLSKRLEHAAEVKGTMFADSAPPNLPLAPTGLPWHWQITDEKGNPRGALSAEMAEDVVCLTGRVDFPALGAVWFQIHWHKQDCAVRLEFARSDARAIAHTLMPRWRGRLGGHVEIAG